MKNLRSGFLAIVLLLTVLPIQSQKTQMELMEVCKAIDYDYFFKHLQYLASDELAGRGIGTVGFDQAADYVINEFQKNGLIGLNQPDDYEQAIDFSKLKLQAGSFRLEVKNESKAISAEYGAQVSAVMSAKYGSIDEKQALVFVGYGNIIPELGIDDYDGLDVKGKTVIVALGGPKGMQHQDFEDRNAKFENAVARGASGLILFYPKASLLQNVIFKQVHGFLSKDLLTLADPTIESLVNVDLRLMLFAKKGFVQEILKLNGLNLKKALRAMAKGQLVSKPLSSSIHCIIGVDKTPVQSKNVVALWPGADPKLKNEYIVLGAHLDGLGIGEAVKGDSIYNGMLDNASGVAALLSISKAFSELGFQPKRSIVFIGYTAEENGLLGSAYFANKNPIKKGKIVANLNMDMLAQTIETSDMAPLGYSHSNLSEATDFAAKQLGFKIDDNRS
ncbi:MAG: M20/M25/M40 family metallo-hydrolase, partial [Bacteroidota bacterium]